MKRFVNFNHTIILVFVNNSTECSTYIFKFMEFVMQIYHNNSHTINELRVNHKVIHKR